jgi:hypothetical protein
MNPDPDPDYQVAIEIAYYGEPLADIDAPFHHDTNWAEDDSWQVD